MSNMVIAFQVANEKIFRVSESTLQNLAFYKQNILIQVNTCTKSTYSINYL